MARCPSSAQACSTGTLMRLRSRWWCPTGRRSPCGTDTEQATIKKLDVRLNQTPALLLSGDVSKISQSFDITSKEQGEVMDFTLKPKTKDTLFDSLRVSFRRGLINDMQLVDSVGQRTNILFNGVKANEAIPASKFQFKIPEGADVIRE